ncbi:MAG: capsule biosynthesis protein CapA [Deltaproteobacteria bacterium]
MNASERHFLFLQGPHGPFFARLAQMLEAAGAACHRVAFNRGDQHFWHDSKTLLPFRAPPEQWSVTLTDHLKQLKITDLVLYGDVRPIHAEAIRQAHERGITVHVFEEGYIRPYWVTYERNGSNGNSRLMELSVADMRAALATAEPEAIDPVAAWGDLRQHIFYGAYYHTFVIFMNAAYRNFKPHRAIRAADEFRLYLRRLLTMPLHWARRNRLTRRIRRAGYPFHVVLLQLAHDSNVIAHSDFTSPEDFHEHVIKGFAEGAPGHHHLVFKAHPLEDGRIPEARAISYIARQYAVEKRVHYVPGGKLARLLNLARSAVTLNSTAGQQALWRGMPLRVFGRAVYDKPEFVSRQPLADFFRAPNRPDLQAYHDFRQYLLETSQVPGGFYSARARSQLLRMVTDMVLAPLDPYDAFANRTGAPRQPFNIANKNVNAPDGY